MSHEHSSFRDSVTNDDLLRFVDDALDDDGRVRVLTYLAARPAEVERMEGYLHQNARLRALREHFSMPDSASFHAPLQAALVARLGRHRARRGWRHRAIAAAAALLVAGGAVGLTFELWRGQEQARTDRLSTPSVAQAFFLFEKPDFPQDMQRVVESRAIETVDNTAFDWLAEQVSDFSVKTPDLAPIGLQLVREETFDHHGAPAVRIIYRDAAGNPTLLYAAVGKSDANHAFWLVREGYLSLQWRRGPMVFAIVAPTGSPQLSDIVELVGAAVARIPVPEAEEAVEPKDQVASPLQAIAAPLPEAGAAPEVPSEPADAGNAPLEPGNAPEPL